MQRCLHVFIDWGAKLYWDWAEVTLDIYAALYLISLILQTYIGNHSLRKSNRVCWTWLYWQVVQRHIVCFHPLLPQQQIQMGDKRKTTLTVLMCWSTTSRQIIFSAFYWKDQHHSSSRHSLIWVQNLLFNWGQTCWLWGPYHMIHIVSMLMKPFSDTQVCTHWHSVYPLI